MAGAALPGRLSWQLATVAEVAAETARTASIALDPPNWPSHRAGQHVDIRLTAEDGYQVQRSYSIASAPGDKRLVLTVERIDDGEVSPYLVGELRPGDELELRGPIGGYFAWEDAFAGPVLLVAGGTGIVPLRAMLRHRVASSSPVAVRLLYSSQSLEDVIYREELRGFERQPGVEVSVALTRAWPADWTGHRGRIDSALLSELAWPAGAGTRSYVCGPSGFVESVAAGLIAAGHPPSAVRTERFGPSGA